jgi:DNA-directed RNA polymerase subunit RPC12/RpoP
MKIIYFFFQKCIFNKEDIIELCYEENWNTYVNECGGVSFNINELPTELQQIFFRDKRNGYDIAWNKEAYSKEYIKTLLNTNLFLPGFKFVEKFKGLNDDELNEIARLKIVRFPEAFKDLISFEVLHDKLIEELNCIKKYQNYKCSICLDELKIDYEKIYFKCSCGNKVKLRNFGGWEAMHIIDAFRDWQKKNEAV